MKLKPCHLLGVVLALVQSVSAEYAHITMDNYFDDWDAIPSVTNDAVDSVDGGVDLKEMWVANDCDYLYIRYTFHAPANPFPWYTRTYIDGDNNPGTGYHPTLRSEFGSEFMVMNSRVYQQAGGNFSSEGVLDNTNSFFSIRPTRVGDSGVINQVELRVSRAAVGITEPFVDLSLMSSNTIRILAEYSKGTYYDHMPDTHGILYTFAPPPSHFKKITIDGSFSDWDDVPPVATRRSKSNTIVDWKALWIANDAKYLYVKFTLHRADDASLLSYFFFDCDNNTESGATVGGAIPAYFGSEMRLVKSNGDLIVFQQSGNLWNEGELDAGMLYAPDDAVATEFEFRIARDVTGVGGASKDQLLFTSDTIRILPYCSNNWIPYKEGAIYTFAPTPPTPLGTCVNIQ